jgi:hypothetical protein
LQNWRDVFSVDAVAGRNLYLCTATNIWTNVNGAAASMTTQAVDAGKLLGTNGAATGWRAMPGFTDNGRKSFLTGRYSGRSQATTFDWIRSTLRPLRNSWPRPRTRFDVIAAR